MARGFFIICVATTAWFAMLVTTVIVATVRTRFVGLSCNRTNRLRCRVVLITGVPPQFTATAHKVLGSEYGEHQRRDQAIQKSTPTGNFRRLSAVAHSCQLRFRLHDVPSSIHTNRIRWPHFMNFMDRTNTRSEMPLINPSRSVLVLTRRVHVASTVSQRHLM
jgi:hypothetical protein